MSEEITTAAAVPAPLVEQVVSVRVSSGTSYGRFSDGESILNEHWFTKVKESEGKPGSMEGIAPDNGADSFVLLERVLDGSSPYPVYKLRRIDRGSLHDIAILVVRFAPDTLSDGQKQYSGSGEKIPNWIVTTKPASPEILAHTARFVGGRTSIKDYELKPQQTPTSASDIQLFSKKLPSPIERLRENPPFVEFVKTHCVDEEGKPDYRVTAVSKAICAYIAENGMTVSSFSSKKAGAKTETAVQQLVAVHKLHPKLKPFLDTQPKTDAGDEWHLSLQTGRLIALIEDPEQQLAVWEIIKDLPSNEKQRAAIKKFREELNQAL